MPNISPDQQEQIDQAIARFSSALRTAAQRGASKKARGSVQDILDQAEAFTAQFLNLVTHGDPSREMTPTQTDQVEAVLLIGEKTAWPRFDTQPTVAGKPVEREGTAPIAAMAVELCHDYVGSFEGDYFIQTQLRLSREQIEPALIESYRSR